MTMLYLKSPLFFYVLIITLNSLDVITTLYGLSIGLTELNPLFDINAIWLKIALPLIYVTCVCVAYEYCQKHGSTFGLKILKLNLLTVNVLYAIIVINNVTLIIGR